MEQYKEYLLMLRDNLIRCGVGLEVKDDYSYEELFNLSEVIDQVLWYYSVLAVVNSRNRLKGFMYPLDSTYMSKMRSIFYAEYCDVKKDYASISVGNILSRNVGDAKKVDDESYSYLDSQEELGIGDTDAEEERLEGEYLEFPEDWGIGDNGSGESDSRDSSSDLGIVHDEGMEEANADSDDWSSDSELFEDFIEKALSERNDGRSGHEKEALANGNTYVTEDMMEADEKGFLVYKVADVEDDVDEAEVAEEGLGTEVAKEKGSDSKSSNTYITRDMLAVDDRGFYRYDGDEEDDEADPFEQEEIDEGIPDNLDDEGEDDDSMFPDQEPNESEGDDWDNEDDFPDRDEEEDLDGVDDDDFPSMGDDPEDDDFPEMVDESDEQDDDEFPDMEDDSDEGEPDDDDFPSLDDDSTDDLDDEDFPDMSDEESDDDDMDFPDRDGEDSDDDEDDDFPDRSEEDDESNDDDDDSDFPENDSSSDDDDEIDWESNDEDGGSNSDEDDSIDWLNSDDEDKESTSSRSERPSRHDDYPRYDRPSRYDRYDRYERSSRYDRHSRYSRRDERFSDDPRSERYRSRRHEWNMEDSEPKKDTENTVKKPTPKKDPNEAMAESIQGVVSGIFNKGKKSGKKAIDSLLKNMSTSE
jgi:hypothetical protein